LRGGQPVLGGAVGTLGRAHTSDPGDDTVWRRRSYPEKEQTDMSNIAADDNTAAATAATHRRPDTRAPTVHSRSMRRPRPTIGPLGMTWNPLRMRRAPSALLVKARLVPDERAAAPQRETTG
jgi:hypothetical protein